MKIERIVFMYTTIIEAISKITLKFKAIKTMFDSDFHESSLGLQDYLLRIVKYTNIEPNTLLLSMMNIDRFCESNKSFYINNKNCHLLIFTSIVVTMKFYEDEVISNKTFSKIGSIECDELLKMEKFFLESINYNLFTSTEKFETYQGKFISYFKTLNKDHYLSEKCMNSTELHVI